ncbi:MAG: prephenate dehydrogenase/arogenate dehydrogenase family protein [Actinomycetes bacterium]
MDTSESRRAQVIGTGLIGGSIGLALRAQGWHVTGSDDSPEMAQRALVLGALDVIGFDESADVTFVATPVGAVLDQAQFALRSTAGLVTDVGSVKAPMLSLMSDPRFVGGHPMAGSELDGVDGARADMFEGATWVLTPIDGTDDSAFATIRSIVTTFGASVLAIPPSRHDSLVAAVSHVPHLTAATMMRLASERSEEHRAVLRLAAGGFRDMTRISAGQPGIWPDICAENRDAIVDELGRLIDALVEVREIIETDDRNGLLEVLESARKARIALPARVARPEDLVEIRVTIPDQQGALAPIFTLATDLDVSIADFEIAHSLEGNEGVLILLVDMTLGDRFQTGLTAAGYRPTQHRIE